MYFWIDWNYKHVSVGFKILRDVAINNIILWDKTLRSPFKISRSFGWTCRLHHQVSFLLHPVFLLGLLFYSEDGRRYFPPKRRLIFDRLHSVITQETEILQNAIVWFSRNVTYLRTMRGISVRHCNWGTEEIFIPTMSQSTAQGHFLCNSSHWKALMNCQFLKNQTLHRGSMKKAVFRQTSAVGSETDKAFLSAECSRHICLGISLLRSLFPWGWVQGWTPS
jgi:hypothetical protein